MKALILGIGISGKSAAKVLEKRGYDVVGVDDKETYSVEVETFDLFVPSPGIPRTHPLYVKANQAGIPIKGEAQLVLENVTQTCIGVTGTKGKTTTVKMIEHCLKAEGKKALAVGNVGRPLSEIEGDEILVVELSSFQLETLQAKVFDIGIILNITEDHLDRYDSFVEYAKTKAHLENCIKDGGRLLVHESVDRTLFSKNVELFSGNNEEVVKKVCDATALSSFEKLPHRMEFVGEIGGSIFWNDSKATNVAAMIYAIGQVEGKVVLLAGGKDKNLSFAELEKVQDRLERVIVFGEAREKIANALQHLVQVHKVATVDEAVSQAVQIAKERQNVLFSPGCASYDAFENYEKRGEAFKESVRRRMR